MAHLPRHPLDLFTGFPTYASLFFSAWDTVFIAWPVAISGRGTRPLSFGMFPSSMNVPFCHGKNALADEGDTAGRCAMLDGNRSLCYNLHTG